MKKSIKIVVAVTTAFLIAGLITFEACRKISIKPNNNVQTEFINIGSKHNEGLDAVYKFLKKESVNKKLDDTCVLNLTKNTVESYLQDEYFNEYEKLRISLSCSESVWNILLNEQDEQSNTMWFAENDGSLTDKEKELLLFIDNILSQSNIDLDDVLAAFDTIKKRVAIECSYEEKIIMNCVLSVGEASCTYWYNNFDDWCILLGVESRGWFNWGNVSREDMSGAIDGAIGGAVAGAIGGGIGAAPGALVGSLGGALGGSAVSAVMQIWDHYIN